MKSLKRLIDKRKFQKSGSNNQATLRESKQLSRSALPECVKNRRMFCRLVKNEKLQAPAINKKLEQTRETAS